MRQGQITATWTGSGREDFATWLRTGIVYEAVEPRADAGVKFNPNHDPANGRFTTGGGGGGTIRDSLSAVGETATRLLDAVNPIGAAEAAPARGPTGIVDLTEHEAAGGHAISEHVGRSDAALKRQLDIPIFSVQTLFGREDVYPSDYGTFLSLGSANRLVSATLAAHAAEVAAVASGRQGDAVLNLRFNAPTGREAHKDGERGQASMRPTYWVRVVIKPSRKLRLGYYVLTAFPGNF